MTCAAMAFNRMTEKVAKTLDAQRHLLSAVGHDLRTPITAMRINLEFVEEDELRERLQINLDELQALTEQVLSAARAPAAKPSATSTSPPWWKAWSPTWTIWASRSAWRTRCSRPRSPAAPTRSASAVRQPGRERRRRRQPRRRCPDRRQRRPATTIVIEDDVGPASPTHDRQRVPEPFVRSEASRKQLPPAAPALGLTLAKAIAEGHGGAVDAGEPRRREGLRGPHASCPGMAVASPIVLDANLVTSTVRCHERKMLPPQ